jgi:homoaconitase/3-isopropylmalate dehydratase large subunit
MAHRYGIFSTGIVLNWEDVTEVLPLTADDEILISDYKAKLIKDEEDTKAYVALNNAQKQMSADVKKYKDLSLEEANAIFNDLNVDENDIPKLISALSKVGIQKRIDNVANTQVQTTRLI